MILGASMFLSVSFLRALLLGVLIRTLDFWKLPYWESKIPASPSSVEKAPLGPLQLKQPPYSDSSHSSRANAAALLLALALLPKGCLVSFMKWPVCLYPSLSHAGPHRAQGDGGPGKDGVSKDHCNSPPCTRRIENPK